MKRRAFLAAVGVALAAPRLGRAQQSGKVYRIGWLGNSKLDSPEAIRIWDAFRLELQRWGWSEGRNITFVHRFADGVLERHPQLARELVELKVDLIMTTSGTGAAAAKNASGTIPVVFAFVPNAVELGLVASLARPGGNLTGLQTSGVELVGKRLELLKEAFPRISRIGYLAVPASLYNQEASRAAEKLGVQLLSAKVERAEDLSAAFAAPMRADAWFIGEAILYFAKRKTIVEAIATLRRPAMYSSTLFVDVGGLMAYSADQVDQIRRAAGLVDKILRGAKPADLPIEQPTRFELAINLKTARQLGITIPPSFLARADRVIE